MPLGVTDGDKERVTCAWLAEGDIVYDVVCVALIEVEPVDCCDALRVSV